jgi:crotonobetainyl-CoA:carnitine CoA-transferase CaiB-like acyl-CoA transferase
MPRRPYRPLRGIRVLSFEIAFSLPSGTRTLAELGAEVVRVAGPARPSGTYISVVDGVFLSKPCVGINLKHEDGRDVARRLVAEADIVCSNFTPNVMAGFGLSPDELLAIKPQLIVLQLTGYGTPGPWAGYPAYGPSTEAAGGLNALMGNETDEPVRIGSGVFADQLSGRFATLAILAALERRQRTGQGEVIDVSMTESITTLLGGAIAGAHLGGETPPRTGNRDAGFAPQGVYPCRGDDQWIAISVRDDRQWAVLAGFARIPEFAAPSLAAAEGRRQRHDTLDACLATWTARFDKDELATALQALGIAAGPVRKPEDSHFDEHLAARGAFQRVQHEAPIIGYTAHPHLANPWLVDGFARSPLAEYRYTGADNRRVLKHWLKMPATEVRRLTKAGALLDVGEVVVTDRHAPPGTKIDPDAGDRLGLPKGPRP